MSVISGRRFKFVASIAASCLTLFLYTTRGYSKAVLFVWLLSMVLGGCVFFSRSERGRLHISKKDWLVTGILFGFFALLYTYHIYTVPFQVNTDEVTIMQTMRTLTIEAHADLFALSQYFYFPSFIFIVMGRMASLFGGIDLYHVRLLHALFGVGIIVSSYVLFRNFFSVFYAAGGALIVGVNHSLFAISRMAMRDNVATLIEVAALTLFIRGFQKKSLFEIYLGGVVAGFGFYNYFPARIVIVLWGVFLFFVFLFFRNTIGFRQIVKFGFASMVGFLLIVAPLAVATLKTPGYGAAYAKEQILLYPEGKELQRAWVNARTIEEGLFINMKNALTALNRPIHDHGYIYPNYGHGFLDPLTGVLLWIGFLVMIAGRNKKPKDVALPLCLGFLLLFFAFLTTKNPNYTRLLLVLPFAGGLVAALFSLADGFVRSKLRIIPKIVFMIVVAMIAYNNALIFNDFKEVADAKGNDVGGTARYVEARNELAPYSFYLAADRFYPYYSWGESWQWHTWLGFFAGDHQKVLVISPESFIAHPYEGPFTLFLENRLWAEYEEIFLLRYPSARVHQITQDQKLVAVEVK